MATERSIRNRKFHRNLKRLAKEQNLSFVQLSEATGIPMDKFQLWKEYKIEPSSFYLIKLANYFNVSKEALCGK